MDNQENKDRSGGGYGKRPLWQWVVIYLVIAAVVYGLIYYFVLARGGGYQVPGATSAPQSQSPLY
ncbi:hypothetical protein A3A14_03805 [Candidatus Daviesbacteria bacterium RIFCSPLOWO2_01_FULL_43_38]|uniref:Uncharacterized protein n=1 Tax=Candidatus Daviesbacteria bacterium RIFCSPHIGHO2_12_FULL_43_11 TaxID=1797780 RepID=A0A1F5K7T1_9BACT|nr:MAG: hypothetical protein A2874_00205 [Candidatus Daviesbacteria bacterium RIFCSPHIGHO2_01_FULL_43_17]OGE36997.1 MAG: hypothetical protein A3E45_01995 [Candidatus Daviesbacteria bacterium RIFCSPHIGHO2_12_FULL_43_11]OGE63935.1 MAG: hypothetical protein A3A14_03805 [Candidatus Daviesbacteria bacterium RIFCSPLOWO2_01_FULL_43_38]OGE69004.1 MAG: hypothetical protein A3J21_02330 [Candidatus Daviesbacteria bacterium RIFCSPLOWO2_02_FULL_43_11]